MARVIEPCPARSCVPHAAERPATPTRAASPAAGFAQLANRLHVGASVQRRAAAGPGRDFSDIAGPGRPPVSGGLPVGLRADLRADLEARSGLPMDDVRVHRDSPRPRTIGALAYAQGRDIHLGPGQERHLPHEAWHVVQQKQGRVKPTGRLGGLDINDNEGLEREADRIGEQAATDVVGERVERRSDFANAFAPVQRIKADRYRGGAELELRQGEAAIEFGNLPGGPEQVEAARRFIREGLKGMDIAELGGDIRHPMVGKDWHLTIETNTGTALGQDDTIRVALELILGAAQGSTLTELLVAAEAAAQAVRHLDQSGPLTFHEPGRFIADAVASKTRKKAAARKILDPEAQVAAAEGLGDPDWTGLTAKGTWNPVGAPPSQAAWGTQVTIAAPMHDIHLVGKALAAVHLTDTSEARPKRVEEVVWDATDILEEYRKFNSLKNFHPTVIDVYSQFNKKYGR